MKIVGREWVDPAIDAHRKYLKSKNSKRNSGQAKLEADAERVTQKQRVKRREVVDALKKGEDAALRAAESEKKARTGKGSFYAKG